MYWKLEALTKTGHIVSKMAEGTLAEIKNEAARDELDVLSLEPDIQMFLQSVYSRGRLRSKDLGGFFTDFARTQVSGLSIGETVESLKETCPHPVLKQALKIIDHSVNDGRSLKEAFENAKCFPLIAIMALSAAEKSGEIPEVAGILGEYFKFHNESKKKVIAALLYPAAVFVALTVASIVITVNLVPQLSKILPVSATGHLSMKLLMAYAIFMKDNWLTAILFFIGSLSAFAYLWFEQRDELMKYLGRIPFIGKTLKEMEFSNLFMSLYVYQKSGIPLLEAVSNISKENKSYMNGKLVSIKEKIIKGFALSEAFKSDDFFPVYIWHSVSKGEKTGNLAKYLQEIYIFYDLKSKESVNIAISLINPALLTLAIIFLGFIVSNFFLPIYQNMATMGGIFR